MNANEQEQADAPETATANAPAAEPVEEDPLTTARAEAAKFRDLAARNQADLENYRKRAVRERDDAVRYANASLIERLLPVLDNFELGLTAARQAGGEAAAIVTGLEMVSRQLSEVLEKEGVQTIDATGQHFDPNLHEAIGHEEHDDVPEGTVIRQVRKGFKMKDRLLRPANVVVSKGKRAASPADA
jgi:molecular chaperone GrpE